MKKNTKLTETQISTIQTQIVELRNTVKACKYAGLSYTTLMNAIHKGGLIKEHQLDKLMKYAGGV